MSNNKAKGGDPVLDKLKQEIRSDDEEEMEHEEKKGKHKERSAQKRKVS
jgi:hypothetical protein